MTDVRYVLQCCVLFFGMANSAYAQLFDQVCDGTNQRPCVVQDSANKRSPMQRFRYAPMIKDAYHGNITGIDALWISGSEELSEQGWMDLAQQLNFLQQEKPIEKIVVVDLRQETHGYLNGIAITLAGENNWVNLDKTNEESARDEALWLDSIRAQSVLTGVLTPDQFKSKQFSQGKALNVSQVQDESWYVNQYGYEYKRIYISDHRAPRDSEVDSLIQMIEEAAPNTWFHVHCRGGKGRTTTLFAMMDIWHNATGLSFEEILLRQASIAPYYNLADVHRNYPHLTPYFVARLKFLRAFYHFVNDRAQGYSGSWSQWHHTELLKGRVL